MQVARHNDGCIVAGVAKLKAPLGILGQDIGQGSQRHGEIVFVGPVQERLHEECTLGTCRTNYVKVDAIDLAQSHEKALGRSRSGLLKGHKKILAKALGAICIGII